MQTEPNAVPPQYLAGQEFTNATTNPIAAQVGYVRSQVRTATAPMEATGRNAPTSSNAPAIDIASLVDQWITRKSLVNRRELIVPLALSGSDEAFTLFEHTLLREFNGQWLTSGRKQMGESDDQESVMYEIAEFMGVLAQRNERAYDFVKKGLHPEFWAAAIHWNSSWTEFARATIGVMTQSSILALGLSGRQEVPSLLQEMKSWPLVDTGEPSKFARHFDGNLGDAAFRFDMVSSGRQWDVIGSGANRQNAFREWQSTTNGRAWQAWHRDRLKARTPSRAVR